MDVKPACSNPSDNPPQPANRSRHVGGECVFTLVGFLAGMSELNYTGVTVPSAGMKRILLGFGVQSPAFTVRKAPLSRGG